MEGINQKINETLIPFSIDLMRVEAGLKRDILKEFKRLEKILIAELINAEVDGVKRTAYKEARLQQLLKQVQASIKSAYKKYYKMSQDEMFSLVDLTDKEVRGAINLAAGANIATTAISPALAEAIVNETAIAGAYQKEWYDKMSKDAQRIYGNAIREGMLKGEGTAEIVRRVKGSRDYPNGVTKQMQNQINATVRSSVNNISNTARDRVYQNNKSIMKGITWVSTLDFRTSTICKVLDGKSWTVDKKPIGHDIKFPGATAHYGCRSTQTPMLKAYKDLPANVRKKIPEGTRASIDGQVAISTDYEKFLKGKTEFEQRKALGATKYRLWKEKKLTFTDLIDQSGNEISVARLLEKYDKAA